MKTIKIIGYGWVGKAMKELFPDARVHDEALGFVSPVKTDIAFVCVPSPCPTKAALDTSIVEKVVAGCDSDLIVIRSTVNPGDCDRWAEKYKKNLVMQPEYLGETPQHPLLDTKATPFMILGGDKQNTRTLIELYTTVYNANVTIRQVSLMEAEVIKLSENRAIGYKVAQCQELYDVCQKAGVDYYTVREAVYGDDPRFTLWWTLIYPEARGFNSKCIPKDIYAWAAWAESLGYKPELTRAMLKRNDEWINENI